MLDLLHRVWTNTTGLIRKLWAIEFLRFLAVGGVNTAFGYGVFALLILLNRQFRICSAEVELVLAPLISQICGILFNFKTTGTVVFRNRNNRLILRFFAVYSITYLLNYGLLRLFESFGVGRLIGGAILVLPLALLAYFLNRKYVFNTLDKKTKPIA